MYNVEHTAMNSSLLSKLPIYYKGTFIVLAASQTK